MQTGNTWQFLGMQMAPSPASLQSLPQRAMAALAAAAMALTPLAGPVALPPPAAAVLNSPNAQIARSADVALRRAIPGNNGYMRSVQVSCFCVAHRCDLGPRLSRRHTMQCPASLLSCQICVGDRTLHAMF